MSALTSLADRIESALWGRQDILAAAQGFQVARVGRWTRRYRHPCLTIALAARAARDADRATDRNADRSERAA
jgi:hypothetical protein